MILDLHRQPSVFGFEGRALGYGPRSKRAVVFKAEIEMQVTCRMFLNDEPKRFGRHDPRVVTGRLRCLREITHVLIGAELGRSHGSLLNNAAGITISAPT